MKEIDMKKMILITTFAMFAGCATQQDYEFDNLLFENEDLLFAAKSETREELEKKDICAAWICPHGVLTSPIRCRVYHCPRPPKR